MGVLTRPFLDGLFNIAYFGIPSYIFIMIIGTGIIITIEVGMWWFYWRPFEYMHGIYRAYWDKINACFIGDLANRFELIPENKAKLIEPHEDYEKLYDEFFKTKPWITRAAVWLGRRFGRNYDMMLAKEMEKDIFEAPVVFAGGIPIELILDLDKWTHLGSPQRQELIALADKWNTANPQDEIHTYRKISEYIASGKITPTSGILKTEVIIPWTRIKAAFPPEENEAVYAGYERQLAEDMAETERAEYKKYFWGIIGFFILMNILMFVARFFNFIGPKPV